MTDTDIAMTETTEFINFIQNGGKKNDGYYYHGSKEKLPYLEPRPSRVIDNELAVFATNKLWLAIIFIAGATDYDIELGFINDKPYILEQNPGAFDKLLKGVSGYVYFLSKKNFRSDKRLGLQKHEFISRQKEKIIKTKYIPNLYDALKKSETNLITFDDKMKCIEMLLNGKIEK